MLNKILARKYGMSLVSGPTGSGKSTTLKSLINMLNDGRKKIITVDYFVVMGNRLWIVLKLNKL